jgi:hypothetical protein
MDMLLDAGADRAAQSNLVFSFSYAGTGYHFFRFVFDMRLRLPFHQSTTPVPLSAVLRFSSIEPFAGLQVPLQHQIFLAWPTRCANTRCDPGCICVTTGSPIRRMRPRISGPESLTAPNIPLSIHPRCLKVTCHLKDNNRVAGTA